MNDTNTSTALRKLKEAGFSNKYVNNFKLVYWDIPNNFYGNKTESTKFETYGNVPNVYYFSGYDGSVVAFLTGVESQISEPKNAEELFEVVMNQEILRKVFV